MQPRHISAITCTLLAIGCVLLATSPLGPGPDLPWRIHYGIGMWMFGASGGIWMGVLLTQKIGRSPP
jgi:hypothetical protein